MRSEQNVVLVVAQRQMENRLQSVLRNLHLLRRSVLGARMQGKGSAGQRGWLPGLWHNFISHLHKTDKF